MRQHVVADDCDLSVSGTACPQQNRVGGHLEWRHVGKNDQVHVAQTPTFGEPRPRTRPMQASAGADYDGNLGLTDDFLYARVETMWVLTTP